MNTITPVSDESLLTDSQLRCALLVKLFRAARTGQFEFTPNVLEALAGLAERVAIDLLILGRSLDS